LADWEANSADLLRNLQELGRLITADAAARRPVSSEAIRKWQAIIMRGLDAHGEPSGAYRGEPGLEDLNVEVGGHPGALAERVAAELAEFDRTLAEQLDELDRTIQPGDLGDRLTADIVNAVIILCAWAHGEWVRIHPFPNGNGRTARILVNCLALRYGVPAFMRVRPRPASAYVWVARQAMERKWTAAIPLFIRLYEAAL
jgi:Fic family protein